MLTTTTYIYLLLAVSYLGCEKPNKCTIGIRSLDWKFDMISDELQPTVSALRKLTITDRAGRVRFYSIVGTFLADLNYGLNAFNTIVPSGFDQEGHDELLDAICQLNNLNYRIQDSISEEPEVIKERLVCVFESIGESVTKIKNSVKFANPMINTQWEHLLNMLIYGINKVKYQVLYFKETDKQVCARITKAVEDLTDAMGCFKSRDKRALIDLRHRCTLMEVLADRIVHKLQSWIRFNCEDTQHVKMAEAIIETMLNLYKRETIATFKLNTVDEIKVEIVSIIQTGAKQVQELAEIDLSKSIGAEEFIRSTLFEAITVGATFAANFRKMPY